MMKSLLFLLILKGVTSLTTEQVRSFASELPQGGKLWAVLVAGSNSWSNYRHQADICHAYHVLHNHGIPDENIVVMMFNDLAYNEENPTPGVIINHINGPNVYKDVPHDYTKFNVKPSVFFNVLWGNETAVKSFGSGKVIKSGPKDHVFVYFADHGAYGLIAFPAPDSETGDKDHYITSDELITFLKSYYKEKKYAKMVLYIEACESGSMFANLTNDMNIFATTAANSQESSYACYFDDKLETYLGDVYSVKWMEDSDKEVLTNETLERQYRIVKEETNTSHVKQFGDLTIGKMHVSEFQGKKKAEPIIYPKVPLNAVSSHEVPVEILKRKLQKTNSLSEQHYLKKQLIKLFRYREYADNVVNRIIWLLSTDDNMYNRINTRPSGTNFHCYNEILAHFDTECFNLSQNEYVLRHMYKLANICNEKISVKKIKEVMEIVCTHPPIHGIK